MADWNPGQYLKFEDERTRPSVDLLRRVPLRSAGRCVDLGCGPGNSTELVAERFPMADVTGIDSSPAMIAKAKERFPGLSFEVADLAAWGPAEPLDLIFANAVLQWVPDHRTLLPRLAGFLRPGGCIAVQMPNNIDEPSHRLMREVAAGGAWSRKLSGAALAREQLGSFEDYYGWLRAARCEVDIWQTVYIHPLAGARAIVEWFKSTGLKPFLDPLGPDERAAFEEAYEAEVAKAYPAQADGRVLLRFPRLFIVARRS
jgi:trans-aconitate 2-methyltransferase